MQCFLRTEISTSNRKRRRTKVYRMKGMVCGMNKDGNRIFPRYAREIDDFICQLTQNVERTLDNNIHLLLGNGDGNLMVAKTKNRAKRCVT